jgi:hypothetical protein
MIRSGTLKLEWIELPLEIRAEVERFLGSPVVEAQTQPGGFSPGVASKVKTGRGTHAFIKSASSLISQPSADANRREIKHTRVLQGNPRVPKLIHAFEQSTWVTLVYELVDGRHPTLPWVDDELNFVLSELAELSASVSPCPHPELFETLEESGEGAFNGWKSFSETELLVKELGDPWITGHLDVLAGLEKNWPSAAKGTSLVHTDLRADQIFLAKENIVFLDWPHAKIGAPWIDFLFMFPSIVLQKGPDMASLVQRSPLARVPRDELIAMAVALAGFFLWNSLQPPPPRLLTLRKFQRDQGNVVMSWLKEQGL